jgi:hypothetical protein
MRPVDLVDHDEAAQRLEGETGVVKPGQVRRVFEVEDGRAVHLPHPAGADPGGDAVMAEGPADQ